MKIIDRYLMREYLVPFFYSLAAFSLLYIVSDLFGRFSDLIDAKVSLVEALLFYLNYLLAVNGFVPFVVIVMPIALLLSALYTLVSLSRHNELVAMRASGLSIHQLTVPFLTLGLLCTCIAGICQETLGPYATQYIDRFRPDRVRKDKVDRDIVTDYLYHTGVTRRHWMIPRFDSKTPDKVANIKVTQDRPDGSLAEEVFADRAEWLDGAWWFFGKRSQKYSVQGEPDGPLSEKEEQPVEMTEFRETPHDFAGDAMRFRNALNYRDFLSTADMVRYIRAHPNLSRGDRARWEVDMHSRIAMPWSCVVMVLLAVPAAGRNLRQGAILGIMMQIGLLFLYYFVILFGRFLGNQGLLTPVVACWLPHVLFLGLGASLTARIQ